MKCLLVTAITLVLLGTLLTACYQVKTVHLDEPVKPSYEDMLPSPERKLKNPRTVKGKVSFVVDADELMDRADLARANRNRGIPENTKAYIQCWMSVTPEVGGQRDVKVTFTEPRPVHVYYSRAPRNFIAYWFIGAKPKTFLRATYSFEYTSYEVNYEVDPSKVGEFDRDNPDYILYTRSEYGIEINDYVRDKAKEIVGDEQNPYLQAKAIFNWVRSNMNYVYPPKARGNLVSLATRSGDCGEFSFVFVSMCRSLGIPARVVFGGWSTPGRFGWHAWAECYIPNYGWLPADPTVAQGIVLNPLFADTYGIPKEPMYYLGNLDNQRIIFSVGNNIPLEVEKEPMPPDAAEVFYLQPPYASLWGFKSNPRTYVDIEVR